MPHGHHRPLHAEVLICHFNNSQRRANLSLEKVMACGVRIRRPKNEELVLQAQDARIFAWGEILSSQIRTTLCTSSGSGFKQDTQVPCFCFCRPAVKANEVRGEADARSLRFLPHRSLWEHYKMWKIITSVFCCSNYKINTSNS